jgi:hypothetical protein
MILALANSRPEDVSVLPIVIAKLELGKIEGQVLFADLMKRADTAALDLRTPAREADAGAPQRPGHALGPETRSAASAAPAWPILPAVVVGAVGRWSRPTRRPYRTRPRRHSRATSHRTMLAAHPAGGGQLRL